MQDFLKDSPHLLAEACKKDEAHQILQIAQLWLRKKMFLFLKYWKQTFISEVNKLEKHQMCFLGKIGYTAACIWEPHGSQNQLKNQKQKLQDWQF